MELLLDGSLAALRVTREVHILPQPLFHNKSNKSALADSELTQPPTGANMELSAIFPPIFQNQKQLVFDAEFGLSTPFATAVKLRTQQASHLFEGIWLDTTSAFEGAGFQVFELLIGHNYFLPELLLPPPTLFTQEV